MKKYLYVLLCLTAYPGLAQLRLQSSGLTLKGGTVFSVDSMVLIPSGDLTLASNTITRANILVRGTSGGGSIRRVHSFSSPITFSGTIGVKYNAGVLNGNVEANQQIAYGGQTAGGAYVTTTGSSRGTAGSYYVSNTVTSAAIGQLTTTNTGVVLPVNLASVAVQAAGNCEVLVTWQSAGQNDQAVAVEASPDGHLWQSTDGTLQAQADGRSFEFRTPSVRKGRSFYRLKLTGRSGTADYSHTMTLDDPCTAKPVLAISPNPAPGKALVTVNAANGSPVLLQLRNGAGTLLKNLAVAGPSGVLDLADVPSGTYFLIMQDGPGTTTLKFQHVE